jgi:site-specific DNA-methyltransferase (adenine-specific)
MNYRIFNGDSSSILKDIPSESAHSLVTDPPAGIGLGYLEWDKDKGGREQWISWLTQILAEAERILLPGAHGLVWAIPRTSHWTALACEDAGFKVKDIITHVFGSGFPKNMSIDKAIQTAKYLSRDELYKVTTWIRKRRDELGLRNEDIDRVTQTTGASLHWTAAVGSGKPQVPPLEKWELLRTLLGPAPEEIELMIQPSRSRIPKDNSEVAQKWQGWGTALKPASEHWILIQKPISEHNIAANVLKYQTGAVNIDASRVATNDKIPSTRNLRFAKQEFLWDLGARDASCTYTPHKLGRHPANFMMTRVDNESCPSLIINDQDESGNNPSRYFKNFKLEQSANFFYSNKYENGKRAEFNTHPTLKSLRLMRYLTKMVTPPGGVVLDPFMGSGTTGVACLFEDFKFVGVEKEAEYFEIAEKRLRKTKPTKGAF